MESKSAYLPGYECVTYWKGCEGGSGTQVSQESGRCSTCNTPFSGRLGTQLIKEKFL